MTDELKPNEIRDALLRRKLTEQAKSVGWKPPGPTSDYATWLLQQLLRMHPCDGLIGPVTAGLALQRTKPPHPSAAEREGKVICKCGHEAGIHGGTNRKGRCFRSVIQEDDSFAQCPCEHFSGRTP